MNLLDAELYDDLDDFTRDVHDRDEVRVVVFASANRDYFIAHYDIEVLLRLYSNGPPKPGTPNRFHLLVDRLRTMPKITIGQIAGRARGAGVEFALGLDIRFAATDSAIFGQPEVALGILPGGGGSQRLPRLLGRARALEMLVGAADLDAALAERYRWINRALRMTSSRRSSTALPGESLRSRRRLSHRRARPPA